MECGHGDNMVKALLFTSAFGDGHRQVACALRYAFAKRGVETVEVDCFRSTSPRIAGLLESTYDWLTRHGSHIYGMMYNRTAHFGSKSKLWKFASRVSKSAAIAAIEEHRPDIVLQVFPDHAIASLPQRLHKPYIGVVLTDYSIHGHWFHENVNTYFLPHERFVARAQPFVPRHSELVVTGIPIRPQFYTRTEHLVTQRQHPYIVFATGGRGVFPHITYTVEAACDMLPDYDVYVMCGRSISMYQEIKEISLRIPRVQALPYVEDVDAWFRGAEFAVIKAGGITVSECLATRCPMVLYRPQPGQEADNAAFLEHEGAGKVVRNLKEFKEAVAQLRCSQRQRVMSQMCERIARSDAAERVVQHVLRNVGYMN
jgi:processive 1,2-diacylglycerol beta-glucosyltransferase